MGFSIPHLLVVLAIVILVFGTKRLKNVGGDLGDAIKSFRKAVQENDSAEKSTSDHQVLEGEISDKNKDHH
ncbi:MAG: Sec-independent protein translocase subunit TatA [Methylococcaceae bacterium]|jgi:sec-independent protein translocase protein TatA|nr:Sec-independent protein translocase subunit TatA [Methylococcaceae bacterium]